LPKADFSFVQQREALKNRNVLGVKSMLVVKKKREEVMDLVKEWKTRSGLFGGWGGGGVVVEGNLEAGSAGHARGDGLQSVFAKKVTIEGFEDVKCSLVFGESIWGGANGVVGKSAHLCSQDLLVPDR
jgi:hypothetical protein